MAEINTGGLEAAPLDNKQMDMLLKAENEMNANKKSGEIYLLAVTRKA